MAELKQQPTAERPAGDRVPAGEKAIVEQDSWFVSTMSSATASAVANTSELVGLVLTMWVAWTVVRLNRTFRRLARAPDQLGKLTEFAGEISRALNNFAASKYDARLALGRLQAITDTLSDVLGWRRKSALKPLKRAIAFCKDNPSEDAYRDVYNETIEAVTKITERIEIEKWER